MEHYNRASPEDSTLKQLMTIAGLNIQEAWSTVGKKLEADHSPSAYIGAAAYLLYKIGPSTLLETLRSPQGCPRSCAKYALSTYQKHDGTVLEKLNAADQRVGMKCALRHAELTDPELENLIELIVESGEELPPASITYACVQKKVHSCS